MASVELKGLSKSYGAVRAVDDISLQVEHGRLLCLLGPSGCGKTTMLRLLAGFVEPTEGEIVVGERVVSSPRRTVPPEQRNMSMIFQSYALWPHMTVAENIGYGLRIRKVDAVTRERKLADILATTHLAALRDRYPGELSGGQQQRVSLARALIVEPETLLLDEPLSNLDANLREEMRFEIRRLHDQYRYTTIYVTHDQAEAMTTADLIAVMNAGRIEQIGTPEEIYNTPRTRFVARFMGASNVMAGKSVGADIIEAAGQVFTCSANGLQRDKDAAFSIRPHEIAISEASAGVASNTVEGRIVRSVFLGASRDYLVELPAGLQVRVAAPAATDIPSGQTVWLYFPPACCRPLQA